MNKKPKSVLNAITGAFLGLTGLYFFYTAMKLQVNGGSVEVHTKGEGWMEPWQCYAAGIGLLLVGVILFLDSIRMVEGKITSSTQSTPQKTMTKVTNTMGFSTICFRPLWIAIVICIPLYLLTVVALPVFDFIFPWKQAVDELKESYPDQNRVCVGIGFSSQVNSLSTLSENFRSYLLFPAFLKDPQEFSVVETSIDGVGHLRITRSSYSIFLEALVYIGCAIFTWKVSIPWFKHLISNKAEHPYPPSESL